MKINRKWRLTAADGGRLQKLNWELERKAFQAAVNGLVAIAYVGDRLRASNEGAIAYECLLQLANLGAIELGEPK